MADPIKQPCGEKHWSGEPCKVCDALKSRSRHTSTPPSKPLLREPDAPCQKCAVNEAINEALNATVARLELEAAGMSAELEGYKLKAERERAAILERVRKHREGKPLKVLKA